MIFVFLLLLTFNFQVVSGARVSASLVPTPLSNHEHVGAFKLGIDASMGGDLVGAVAGAVHQVQEKVVTHLQHLDNDPQATVTNNQSKPSIKKRVNRSEAAANKLPIKLHLNQSQPAAKKPLVKEHLHRSQPAAQEHQNESKWWGWGDWWAGQPNQSQPAAKEPAHSVSVKETRNQSGWWGWAADWWPGQSAPKHAFVKKHLNESEPGVSANLNQTQPAAKHPSREEGHNDSQPFAKEASHSMSVKGNQNHSGWWGWSSDWWPGQSAVMEDSAKKHLNQSQPVVEEHLNQTQLAAKEPYNTALQNESQPAAKQASHSMSVRDRKSVV